MTWRAPSISLTLGTSTRNAIDDVADTIHESLYDGSAAVEMLVGGVEFDLAFFDINMPIMVGRCRLHLGWRYRIRTDSVEGRIRTDSAGFRAAP